MLSIEGVGDDLLYAFAFIGFIVIVILAWLSSHVNNIQLPTTLFIIERRTHLRNEEQSERASVTPSRDPSLPNEPASSSANETSTEHESDNESSENDEFLSEQTPISSESSTSQISESQLTTNPEENQLLRITIKFLNETQKSVSVNSNDTILKIKTLYFTDELANDKIIRFIYRGRELKDTETFRSCNIEDQTVIHCHITTRRLSTSSNPVNDNLSSGQMNSNSFDTSFIDTSPINISPSFLLVITIMLGLIWYIRVKYRYLFTPISTIILLLITILLLIFTCGLLLTARRQIPQHVHID